MLTIWPELAAVKVRRDHLPPAQLPPALVMKGFRGEGIAAQVVLRTDTALTGITPFLAIFTGANQSSLPQGAAKLYRVGYLNVATPSDPAGAAGEWPDALYPIGTDPFYGELRNGAPFNVAVNSDQPVWLDVRIPNATLPGDYRSTFEVVDANGNVLAR